MSDQDVRGRARGRSRSLRGESDPDDSVRRPREHGTAPYTTHPPHVYYIFVLWLTIN